MRRNLLSDIPCVRALSLLMLLSACRPGPADRLQQMSLPYPEGGQNMTPLAVAAFKGHTNIVKALLAQGADVNVMDKTGSTPLMHAADQGHSATVKALLEGDANVNFRTEGDVTALMVAAHKGDDEIVRALIAAGADVKAKTAQGYTALMAAREEGHPQVASLLLAAGAAETQPASASWRTFVSAGRTYTVPPQWAVADPFTDRTPYWGEYAQLHTIASKDGPGTHRVLLRSPVDDQSQIFLIHGAASHWQPLLQKAFTDMEKTPWVSLEKEQTDTADGVTVKYVVTRMGRGLLAGEDITYVFGAAHFGLHVFIVDAGGLTESFDPDLVIKCIQSLHLKEAS